MTSLEAAPRLLIVEDDTEIRETLAWVLIEDGYGVMAAASLPDALALLQHETFDFVLTDLFRTPPDPPLQSLLPLLKQATPTPVGIMTAWNIAEEEARQADFACLIHKPFDVNAVMATLAICLNRPMTPKQEQQAHIVRGNLAAIVQQDIEKRSAT